LFSTVGLTYQRNYSETLRGSSMEELVYFINGVAGLDKDSSKQPAQGLTVHVYRRGPSGWTAVPMSDGQPHFGYKAREIDQTEYVLWKTRIAGAAGAGASGYTDSGGTWFPGQAGSGVSVIDIEAYRWCASRVAATNKAATEQLMARLAPAYKLAVSMAAPANLDPAEVLATFRPELSKETIAALKKAYKG